MQPGPKVANHSFLMDIFITAFIIRKNFEIKTEAAFQNSRQISNLFLVWAMKLKKLSEAPSAENCPIIILWHRNPLKVNKEFASYGPACSTYNVFVRVRVMDVN